MAHIAFPDERYNNAPLPVFCWLVDASKFWFLKQVESKFDF